MSQAMSDLAWYLEDATPEEAALLRAQWADAVEKRTVRCPCGQLRALELVFRCLYCGVYFCLECAEMHFGETRRAFRERPD